jgi:N-glycosylase/DNA lyase
MMGVCVEILKFIDELPDEQYRTMAEVMKALGEVE